MSNLTDGKKALAAGNFSTAEKKLLKALDKHPDDGELWWAVMLCKFGYRNDGELESAVKAQFRECARSGEKAPSTPFESSYCKNALAYERGTRRREFVERLNGELAELWRAERGTTVKMTKPKPRRKPVDKCAVMRGCMYAAIALATVGGMLGGYSVYAQSRWAMYVGFITFMVFAVVSAALRYVVMRAGGSVKGALPLMVALFAFVCLFVLIGGLMNDNRVAVFGAAAVLVMILLFATVGRVFMPKRDGKEKRRAGGGKTERKNDYDRSNALVEIDKNNKREKPEKINKQQSNKGRNDEKFEDVYD